MLRYVYNRSGNLAIQALEAFSPQITGQPIDQVAGLGGIATFSVVIADSRGIAFQWMFNGANIAGATRDSLVLTNVSAADEGLYSVVVTNSAGSVTSTDATLMLDTDGDGLPDVWEIARFGDTASERGEGDADKDGVSNLDEFLDNTDPNKVTSLRPRLIVTSDSGGSVTLLPMKLSYDLGETVLLTATPFAPSLFLGWAGDLSGTDNPLALMMDGNKVIRARFASAMELPPGLVAFWRGETDASDLIDGHNGTFFVGTSATTPKVTESGKVGGAFTLDGTVHLEVPDSIALRPTQITLEAWVFPTLFAFEYQTIIARGSLSGKEHAWFLGLLSEANVVSAGRPHFRTSPSDDILRAPEIPLHEWTHLAASFDGNIKRLYVNGVLVASRGAVSGLVYEIDEVPVTIGSDFAFGPQSNALHFHGRIDEVGIYNRALTSNEIVDIFNADLAGRDFSKPYFTSPPHLADGVVGVFYSREITTVLGSNPITFLVSAGSLPTGMTLGLSGRVNGIPGEAVISAFTVRATDATGVFSEQACTLKVVA